MPTLADVDASDFKDWMTANGWTVRSLGPALGMNWRTIQRYRDGSAAVPRVVELAIQTLGPRPAPDSPPEPVSEWERVPAED